MTDQGAERRVQGIDLLRGLCIVAVVLLHVNMRIPADTLLPSAVGTVIFSNGYYGVRVFFVISGFLIASWSLKRWGTLGSIDLRQFYVMRFARIVPCLLGLLALLTLLDRLGVPRFTIAGVPHFSGYGQHASLGQALLAALTFHTNWLESHHGYLPAAWDVLWSLSVEEAFYFFFPLVCGLVKKQWLLNALLLGFVVIGPFARLFARNEIWSEYGYLSCMDAIALGCLAALVNASVRFTERANLALRICGGLLVILIAVVRVATMWPALANMRLSPTVLQIGTAMLLIALQQRFEKKTAQTRTATVENASKLKKSALAVARFPLVSLTWFGRNSYEVYLTHVLVMWPTVMLFQHFHQSLMVAPLWFLTYTVLAGTLGYLVSQYYSEPLNRTLRTRLGAIRPRVDAPVIDRVEEPSLS